MAAGRLPAIGSKLGPCAEPCQHIDCAATRRDAASICELCKEPIGYEARFYIHEHDPARLVHADCLEREVAG